VANGLTEWCLAVRSRLAALFPPVVIQHAVWLYLT
jgi:hypothetical protein